jgi:hypothetical protein
MNRNGQKPWIGLLFGLLALTGAPGVILSGCETPAQPPPPANTIDTAGVVYEGLATDEALVILLALEARSEPAENAVVDYPADQMALPAATPATFAWHIGEMAGVWPSLESMLGPRAAYAHGAPVNGRGYFLVFSTPSSPKLLRVFTTDLTYTPDAAAWASLVGANLPISLTITNAIFEDNRVAQDGGPYVGSSVSFSISP